MEKAYFANGLFSLGDRILNERVVNHLRNNIEGLSIYLPQENEAINDKNSFASSIDIAKADLYELYSSDFMIAVIDGVEIDSGVASEIGIAYERDIPIYALYTDVRLQGTNNMKKINALIEDATENQYIYRNLFALGLIKDSGGGISHTIEDLEYTIRTKQEGVN